MIYVYLNFKLSRLNKKPMGIVTRKKSSSSKGIKSNVKEKMMKYIYKGKTLKKFCKDNGLNKGTVYYRLSMGYSLEDAVKTDRYFNIGRNDRNRYYYEGKTMLSYCKENNLPYRTIMRRIQKGWDIEEAIKTPFVFYGYNRKYKDKDEIGIKKLIKMMNINKKG